MNIAFRKLKQAILKGVAYCESQFKQWTQPSRPSQVTGTLADLTRSRAELIAENMFLRQQLIVLQRQVPKPKLSPRDRQILVLLASRLRGWREALVLVKPDTLLGWHRQGFKLYWRRKSQVRRGRPPTSPEVIALIEEMAINNRTWRAPRIVGELLKLGIVINKDTVRKYMRQARKGLPPLTTGQTWATFLKNHAGEIWACDFLQTYDVFFRVIYVYFIIELGSRRVVHCGVTRHPSDFWVAQQMREATPFEAGPRFLIRDNDSKYGPRFDRVLSDRGIDLKRTPYKHQRPTPFASGSLVARGGSVWITC